MKQLTPPVNTAEYIFGNPDATLELVEYGDYECPYCGRAHRIIKEIQKQFERDIRMVFRNFPLRRIHSHAFAAALAAEAAGLQGKFWRMHDILFENQKTLDAKSISNFARTIGLDSELFENDIQQEELADKVERDFESGMRSGVNKTPTFFVNGRKYEGDWEEDKLLGYLEGELAAISITKK